MQKTTRQVLEIGETSCTTWFERDRAHVALMRADTEETIYELWDEDVEAAVENGFLNPGVFGRGWHESMYNYAKHLGIV